MALIRNPFEYEQATKFTNEEIIRYYSEDFNYSRFIHSKRNIFLIGERGTGKTMALLYYSFPVRKIIFEQQKEPLDFEIISIYVPCNTPLTHREDYKILPALQANLISEHFLVISILNSIINTIKRIECISFEEKKKLLDELEYILNMKFHKSNDPFESILLTLDRANADAQKLLGSKSDEIFPTGLLSFSSGVHPLLTSLRGIKIFSNSHFSIMIDDAQILNPYQVKCLNSWIAYRYNDLFSFKVTTTRVDAPSFETASGGSILEGHDFIRVDMEQPYQNDLSTFGRLAKEIIMKRLKSIGLNKSPVEFFPCDVYFERDIQKAKEKAISAAKIKFKNGTQKQIIDYVYKYTRAFYFKERSSKANLPPYSGFETIVHLSSGVVRNLLDPCYYMYDLVYSKIHSINDDKKELIIDSIPPAIQNEIIQERSKRKWEFIRNDLSNSIVGCSLEDAKYVYQLIDNLVILFKKRLVSEISEPRAVVFTISSFDENAHIRLIQLIDIGRRAQLIYTYPSVAKDLGKRETYYVLNRILLPQRGLDPVGQHARVSIKAIHLLDAAIKNKIIPFGGDKNEKGISQLDDFQ